MADLKRTDNATCNCRERLFSASNLWPSRKAF